MEAVYIVGSPIHTYLNQHSCLAPEDEALPFLQSSVDQQISMPPTPETQQVEILPPTIRQWLLQGHKLLLIPILLFTFTLLISSFTLLKVLWLLWVIQSAWSLQREWYTLKKAQIWEQRQINQNGKQFSSLVHTLLLESLLETLHNARALIPQLSTSVQRVSILLGNQQLKLSVSYLNALEARMLQLCLKRRNYWQVRLKWVLKWQQFQNIINKGEEHTDEQESDSIARKEDDSQETDVNSYTVLYLKQLQQYSLRYPLLKGECYRLQRQHLLLSRMQSLRLNHNSNQYEDLEQIGDCNLRDSIAQDDNSLNSSCSSLQMVDNQVVYLYPNINEEVLARLESCVGNITAESMPQVFNKPESHQRKQSKKYLEEDQSQADCFSGFNSYGDRNATSIFGLMNQINQLPAMKQRVFEYIE